MNKKELRSKYKALRQELSGDLIEEMSIAIANNFLKLNVKESTYCHIFLPIENKKEIDTSFLLSVLHGKDKEVVVSRTNFKDGTLEHFLLTENTKIAVNSYGIPEPLDGLNVPVNKIDVVFVPLLCFDKTGHRVGYGKGFYDRFLAQCKPDALKIGLSFFPPEDRIDDTHEGDIPLDYCISPEKIYAFS